MDVKKSALSATANPVVYDEAFTLLNADLRAGVESGEYFITEPRLWRDAQKPVIKKSLNGTLVKGSGRMAGTMDQSEATRISAIKNRKGYRSLIEDLIPSSSERDNPNALMSFKELVTTLIDACMGSPQQVTCTSCGDKFQTAMKKDGSTLYKLFENLNGKAKETQEINMSSQHLSVVLNERTPVHEITVRELPQHLLEERAKMVIEHE